MAANAQITTDFSNNLFTDLAPLLALFGEHMTRQYLSESTSFSDYIIFALAPIGILTTLTSVIRVAGSPWLRAFIGRAQEGLGSIEAELMTSTSRDVCELFNNGGITRVLGRPKLLEIIYVPDKGLVDTGSGTISHFRDYLDNTRADGISEWQPDRKTVSKVGKRPAIKENTDQKFPPNPNLTLNVGVVKLPRIVFYAVMILGLCLQTAVLTVAGVGAFRHSRLLGVRFDSTEPPDNLMAVDKSAYIFIIGTLVMSCGVFLCAYLIGQSSSERTFRRMKPGSDSHPSQLFWVQPGNQLIGDQNFDAYAYTKDQGGTIKHYMASRKATKSESEHFNVLALAAVVITFGGFVTQFIGLRGLGPWIAIGQVAITLIMTICRGLLKARKLQKTDNDFGTFLDLIVGHELDWLALKLPRQRPSQQGPNVKQPASSWYVTGNRSARELKPSQLHPAVKDVLKYRKALARLSGHRKTRTPASISYFHADWDDKFVKVRQKARQVARAITQTCQVLYGSQGKDFLIRLPVALQDETQLLGYVEVIIRCPTPQEPNWRADSSELEGIIGLWVWSFYSEDAAKTLEKNDDDSTKCVVEEHSKARIVGATPSNHSKHHNPETTPQLDMWLGPSMVSVKKTTLSFDHEKDFGTMSLWNLGASGLEPVAANAAAPQQEPDEKTGFSPAGPTKPIRLFGWNTILDLSIKESQVIQTTPTSSSPQSSNSNLIDFDFVSTPVTASSPKQAQTDLTISYVDSSGDLLSECTVELYSIILSQLLIDCHDVGEITPEVKHNQLRLENSLVSDLQDVFIHPDVDLGSDRDALLCILPALQRQLSGSHGLSLVPALQKAATEARQNSLWENAEKLMQYACNICEKHMKSSNDNDPFRSALVAIGEFYRWFLTQRPRREKRIFGYRGIVWLTKKLASVNTESATRRSILSPILHRYIALGVKCAQELQEQKLLPISHSDNGVLWENELKEVTKTTDTATMNSFIPAKIRKRLSVDQAEFRVSIYTKERTRCLYYLGRLSAGTLNDPELHSMLPLAALSGWDEVVDALIQLEVSMDSKDEHGKTAVIHYAFLGRHDRVEALVRAGAGALQEDDQMNSALLYAAQEGHEEVVRVLLSAGDAGVNGNTEASLTPLAAAAINGHETIIDALLSEPQIDGQMSGKANLTPLLAAIQAGFIKIVRKFVAKKKTWRVDHLNTGLRVAAHWNRIEIFKLLLTVPDADPFEKGDCPGARSDEPYSTLDIAAKGGHQEITELILEFERTGTNYDRRILPLCLAVNANRPKVVRALIDRDACHINEYDEHGKTVLIYATFMRRIEIMELLISTNSIDVNKPDQEGKTALIHAAIRGYADVVTLLARSDKCEVDAVDKEGNSALIHATLQNRGDVVSILVDCKRCDLNMTDRGNRTALTHATLLKRVDIVSTLVHSNDCNTGFLDGEGKTALIHAVLQREEDLVAVLVTSNLCNINEADREGKTALIHAILQGEEAIVAKIATSNLCDINKPDGEGKTALIHAVQRSQEARGTELVETLLKIQDCDVNLPDDEGKTALIYSTEQGREDLVSIILKLNGACDINKLDMTGKTALYYSVEQKRKDLVSLLVHSGIPCDINKRYEHGKTVLMHSIEKGYGDIASILITSSPSCDVDVQDYDGNTALIYAAHGGHIEIASVLIEEGGASLHIAGNNGFTPLYHAMELGCKGISTLITNSLHQRLTHLQSDVTGFDWISKELFHALQRREPDIAQELAQAVVMLFKQDKIGPSIMDGNGKSALEQAIELGYESVATVLQNGLPQPKEYSLKAFEKLRDALKEGDVSVAKQLIQEGECDLTTPIRDDFNSYTYNVFTLSAARGYTDIVRAILLDDDFDVNQIDEDGETALSRAIRNGHEQIVDVLLNDKRIKIHTQGPGQSPRHIAFVVYLSSKDSSAMLRSILSHGQCETSLTPLDKRALFEQMVMYRKPNCLQLLFEQFPSFPGSDSRRGGHHPSFAEHLLVSAVLQSSIECAIVLLEYGHPSTGIVIQALRRALLVEDFNRSLLFANYLFANSSAAERCTTLSDMDQDLIRYLHDSEVEGPLLLSYLLHHIIVFSGSAYIENTSLNESGADDPDFLSALGVALTKLSTVHDKSWNFFRRMIQIVDDQHIDGNQPA